MKNYWISKISENQCCYIDLSTFRHRRDRFENWTQWNQSLTQTKMLCSGSEIKTGATIGMYDLLMYVLATTHDTYCSMLLSA